VPEQTDGMSAPESRDWGAWSRDAQRLMQERNEAWQSRFALRGQPYRWDLQTGTLRFERTDDDVVAEARLVGTASESEGTFLWSWANDGLPPRARTGLERVREFGQQHGLTLLNTPEFRSDRAQGTEMLATAARILDAEGLFMDRTGDLTLFFALFHFEVRHKNNPAGSVQHLTLPVLDDEGAHEMSKEVLEAEPGDNGCWRLLHSPALVDGVARGDLIRLAPEEPCGFVVVERAGNLAIVVVTPPGEQASCRRALEPAVLELGGVCEGGPPETLIFSIPVSVGFRRVEELFDGAAERKVVTTWWFGNVYGPGKEPLNWWTDALPKRSTATTAPPEPKRTRSARAAAPGARTQGLRRVLQQGITVSAGRRARTVAGYLLVFLGGAVLFHARSWIPSVWHGPRPISFEELSSVTEPAAVPNRWVSFDFTRAVDTGIRENTSVDPSDERKYILIQVQDSWLVAEVRSSFASSHIEGYLETTAQGIHISESLVPAPGAKLLPCQLDGAYPLRAGLYSMAGLVAVLVVCGLWLALGK
jgi:Domain of unknown function (DUF4265)